MHQTIEKSNSPYWSVYDTNNNNDDPDERTDMIFTDKPNRSDKVCGEYLISDDEDPINQSNKLIGKKSFLKPYLTNTSGNNTNNDYGQFYNKQNIIGCPGMCEHTMKSLPKYIISTSFTILWKLFLFLFYLFYFTFLNFYKWLTEFTEQENLWKSIKAFPLKFIERLYCFCSMNECRRISAKGFLTTHPRNRCNEDDTVITKCSWPLWVSGAVVLLILICACHYANPQASIREKYDIGIIYFKEWLKTFVFNLYNLPGYECMLADNCCTSRRIAAQRWIYCFFTLPYRTSISGSSSQPSQSRTLDENLQNLTDWKLKRNIRRLKNLISELNSKIFVISKKISQTEKLLANLEIEVSQNLSRITYFVHYEEEIDSENEENIKRLEELSAKTNLLLALKTTLDDTVLELSKCTSSFTNNALKDLDKYTSDQINCIDKLNRKIQIIEQKFHEKLKESFITDICDDLKKQIVSVQNDNVQLGTKLSNLESFQFKFQGDIDIFKRFVRDRAALDMNRISHNNRDLLEKMAKMISLNLDKINLILSQRRSSVAQLTNDLFDVQYKKFKHDILEEFCLKIREYVRMTILSTLTLSDKIKGCGFVSGIRFSDKECLLNHFKEIDKNLPKLSCCRTMSDIYQRLNTSFNTFSSDKIGLADYALVQNGGKILELYTTTSFYYKVSEDNYELSDLSYNTWNEFFFFHKPMLNSVNLLNNDQIQPGRCWQFMGHEGSTIIKLGRFISVTMVTLDHIHPNISLRQTFSDATNEFDIHALINEVDSVGILLGSFQFEDLLLFPSQQFPIKTQMQTQFIKFTVKSNHGANITCVYRLRIHGSPVINQNGNFEA